MELNEKKDGAIYQKQIFEAFKERRLANLIIKGTLRMGTFVILGSPG